MRIYGVDFTSRPTRRKPVTCAACLLEGRSLYIDGFVEFQCFDVVENFLASEGPWVAGLDFPFGQPRRLVADLGWPADWEGYVGRVAGLEMRGFEDIIRAYCRARAPGDRYRYRATDRLAGARSPMMLHRVPVGRMFFRGAPRLLASGASVLPCRPTGATRMVLEAYPALVARHLVGRRSYKSDERKAQTPERRDARAAIVARLGSPALAARYGFDLRLHHTIAEDLVEEPGADHLDALLCAIQAAWAWTRRAQGFGIPKDADAAEGWIVDPETAGFETRNP